MPDVVLHAEFASVKDFTAFWQTIFPSKGLSEKEQLELAAALNVDADKLAEAVKALTGLGQPVKNNT